MPDEVLIGLIVQLPLVAAVTWAFSTGRVHSNAELTRREREHEAELVRRSTTLQSRVDDWHTLYDQERRDRIEADRRLSVATGELKEVTARVEELTKEVIRSGRS